MRITLEFDGDEEHEQAMRAIQANSEMLLDKTEHRLASIEDSVNALLTASGNVLKDLARIDKLEALLSQDPVTITDAAAVLPRFGGSVDGAGDIGPQFMVSDDQQNT